MKLAARFQALSHAVAWFLQMIAGAVLVLTAICVTLNATLRYGFHKDIALLTEAGGYIFLFVVFFGLAAAFVAGSHVSIEILSLVAPKRLARFMYDIVVPLVSMVFVGAVLYAGAVIAQRYYLTGRLTDGSVPLPFWWFIAIVPIGCVAMELSLLSHVFENLRKWKQTPASSSKSTR